LRMANNFKHEPADLGVVTRLLNDLNDLKVVDGHCHMFSEEAKESNPFEKFTLGGKMEDIKNTMLYHHVFNKMSKMLSCEPALDKILEIRRKKAERFSEYISYLFNDARIDTLIVDTGYPPTITIDQFEKLVPAKIYRVFRIDENLFDELLDNSEDFDEMLDNYLETLNRAIKEEKVVALKSIIAYTTGLHIKKVEEQEAESIFKKFISSDKSRFKETYSFKMQHYVGPKKLRDFLFWRALEMCIKEDIPMQIHTGDGDIDMRDLSNANPLLLHHVLNDKELSKAKLVLLHAGYPYVDRLGFLANLHPNVYMDISFIPLFASIGIFYRLVNAFEMVPLTKILYGSDAFQVPEMYWFSAKLVKESLRELLEQEVNRGALDEGYAYKVAEMILSENARRLYKI